jgi:hypothetical protein
MMFVCESTPSTQTDEFLRNHISAKDLVLRLNTRNSMLLLTSCSDRPCKTKYMYRDSYKRNGIYLL